ncbi:hypothetical protein BGZ63DRAFT_428888 [Mariannaea sp. PMI_226]|nr:hypothetical protein BGZ63DRAFT_428888 [Mariannaea sp. PMI_226]
MDEHDVDEHDVDEHVGKPCAKPILPWTHCVAVLASCGCLAFSICLILPSLPLGWQFNFGNQLILLGLALSLMNKCLQVILPTTFLVIEARWGHSLLQTYDAILRNSFTQPGTRLLWRLVLFTFIFLPVGLSVAYKQFIGGETSKRVEPKIPYEIREYGLFTPTNNTDSLFNSFANAPYLLTNATFDFFEKSATDDSYPIGSLTRGEAVPYGYNLLLLSNNSAAALDMPRLSYINQLRAMMSTGESYNISADVYGIVAQLNNSIEAVRDNDNFWNATIYDDRFHAVSSFATFRNNFALGLVPYILEQNGTVSCYMGMYGPSNTNWNDYYSDPNDSDVLAFRNSTLKFTTHRTRCHASWCVTTDSIKLLQGSCPKNSSQGVISSMYEESRAELFSPYPLDALPVLVHSLMDFADTRADSIWKEASYAIAVAAMYWARGAYMLLQLPKIQQAPLIGGDITYSPMQESIVSTKAAFQSTPVLYFVLAIQPCITLVAFFLNLGLYSTPIGVNFGLVSILSGVCWEDVGILQGAGLSGSLKKDIRLGIQVDEDNLKPTLRYNLETLQVRDGNGRLESKKEYS